LNAAMDNGVVGDHRRMLEWLALLVGGFGAALRSRRALALENLLLRQQLAIALRTQSRPRLRQGDRVFWVVARRVCAEWQRHLVLVQPTTVVGGKKSIRQHWQVQVRHAPGRA
jgi:hypothetical protein